LTEGGGEERGGGIGAFDFFVDIDKLPSLGDVGKGGSGAQSRKRKRDVCGHEGGGGNGGEDDKENDEFMSLSLADLKGRCRGRDEAITGSKKELVERLRWAPKPQILVDRSRRNQYVPKPNSANAALMVALLLNHTPGEPGMEKETLMAHADQLGISKDPMGGTGGWYDGWSSVKLLVTGDPPLVQYPKRRYSLTTQPPGQSGVEVAKALHELAHRPERMGGAVCSCGAVF
jgi:hypothetical protein